MRPIKTWFPFGSTPLVFKLASISNSPDRSTKSTRSTINGLPLLVNIGFQVLFHSPPGVLFTFPSQYYALSVTKEYLALGGGPPCFPQDFSCPVVLWILLAFPRFHLQDFHLLWCAFPKHFDYLRNYLLQSSTPDCTQSGLGSFPFARRYLGNRCFFLLLQVLRCFSSLRSLYMAMDSPYSD